MPRPHVALFTPGYPHVDAAIRAVDLARKNNAGFSRTIGEPLSLHRDQFVRWLLDSDASHALLLEGDIVPPDDALERLLDMNAPVATAVYAQWTGDRLSTNVQCPGDPDWSTRVPAGRFEVVRCLLGCVLVSRAVFAALRAPWFLSTTTPTRFVTDDEWFCKAVARAGLPIVCDGGVVCASFRQGADLRALAAGRLIAA